MPNYTSDRYRFDGGYWIWFLEREKDKIKKEIIEHKTDISYLCLDERKELDRLVERFKDPSLYELKRGDKRVSRKLRNIWEEIWTQFLFFFIPKTMIFNLKKKGDLDTVPFLFHTKNHDIEP